MSEEDDNSKREKFSGLILPWLEQLYQLFLDPLRKKHNLVINEEFWMFLSFGVFSSILYFTKVNLWVPLSFLIGAAIVFLLHNSSYIRRRIFPKDSEKIDEFIKDIKSKQLEEILMFIRDYQLDVVQIIKIIEHRKDSQDVFAFIKKYQSIKSEFIEYLISNKLYAVIDADLFSQYLIKSTDHISKEKYDLLKTSTKNKKIVKTLNLCYPFYLQNHSIFKFFSNLLIDIRHSVNYGSMKFWVFVLSLGIVSFTVSKDPNILRINASSNGSLFSKLIENIFAFIIISVGLTILFLLIIRYVFRTLRTILYLFAPNE